LLIFFITDITPCIPLPGFDVIHNLPLPFPIRPPQPDEFGVIVGLAWSGSNSHRPYLRSNPMPDLDYNECAQMQQSYVISHCASARQVWEFCHIPRKKKGHTKETELVLLGQILEDMCAVNDDKPPIAIAHDFHGSFIYILMISLGLLSTSKYIHLPFWRHCRFVSMSKIISNFPYSALYYKEHPMFNQGLQFYLKFARMGPKVPITFQHFPTSSNTSNPECFTTTLCSFLLCPNPEPGGPEGARLTGRLPCLRP
jgi:hypothetical protein